MLPAQWEWPKILQQLKQLVGDFRQELVERIVSIETQGSRQEGGVCIV